MIHDQNSKIDYWKSFSEILRTTISVWTQPISKKSFCFMRKSSIAYKRNQMVSCKKTVNIPSLETVLSQYTNNSILNKRMTIGSVFRWGTTFVVSVGVSGGALDGRQYGEQIKLSRYRSRSPTSENLLLNHLISTSWVIVYDSLFHFDHVDFLNEIGLICDPYIFDLYN